MDTWGEPWLFGWPVDRSQQYEHKHRAAPGFRLDPDAPATEGDGMIYAFHVPKVDRRAQDGHTLVYVITNLSDWQ
jgi:hypothetical protein